MNNYYIFYVGGEEAKEYLGGTNYVGVWEDNSIAAENKIRRSFREGTFVCQTTKSQVQGQIGYLY